MQDLWFIVAGFFIGLVVGLTGVGGGSLRTPILIVFFDVKPYVAHATDWLFAAVTKAGGRSTWRAKVWYQAFFWARA